MKAAVLTSQGLIVKDVLCDCPSEHVKVDIIAAALNRRDYWITKGKYPGIQHGIALGSDGVGEYNGKKVILNPGLDWGDHERYQSSKFRVLGMPDHGTFAESLCIDKRYLYEKPKYLTDIQAAALPLAGVTAFRTLFSRCELQKGEKVLISGIGGGVALMAAQFAIAHDCEVYVTSGSIAKIDKSKALGVTDGVLYKDENWYDQLKEMAGGFDVIIDSAGGASFQHFIKLCNYGARIGFYGAGQGKYENLDPFRMFWKQISLLGSTMGSEKDFKSMLDFVDLHQITPIVDQVFSIENIQEAFDYIGGGSQFGKVVIDINLETD